MRARFYMGGGYALSHDMVVALVERATKLGIRRDALASARGFPQMEDGLVGQVGLLPESLGSLARDHHLGTHAPPPRLPQLVSGFARYHDAPFAAWSNLGEKRQERRTCLRRGMAHQSAVSAPPLNAAGD